MIAKSKNLLTVVFTAALFVGQFAFLESAWASAWLTNEPMNVGRFLHTATLLQNGNVLVTGGSAINGGIPTNSAELYDPTTGVWTPTGPLKVPRTGHNAILLQNGKVLIIGGFTTNYSLTTETELYDPLTGTWTSTGSLHLARYEFTATLLLDGTVLLVGGTTLSTNTPTAEVYDPATGLWSWTSNLQIGRIDHTATLLLDGRVLVAGGAGNTEPALSSMELYNPSTKTWSSTGPMITARNGQASVLLPNGQVLFAGGADGQFFDPYFSSAELYDPVTGTNSPTGTMSTARLGHTATLLPNGTVLVAGGEIDNYNDITNNAEIYDPATKMWSLTAPLSTPRFLYTATLLPNGEVLVVGGQASISDFSLSSAESYDSTINPSTGTWTNTGSMNYPHFSFTMTLLANGKVLVAGDDAGAGTGTTTTSGNYSSVELYDPISQTWSNTGSLNEGRFSHTATLLPNGKVLVAGGNGDYGFLTTMSAELYDPITGTWTMTGSMNGSHFWHTATLLLNGKVLVAGLNWGPSAELYDPATGTWTPTGNMHVSRGNHRAVLLKNGTVIVMGGVNSSSNISSTELYDPITGKWTLAGNTRTCGNFSAAVLLQNGNVLFVGTDTNGISSADLYDPTTGLWKPVQAPKHTHYAATLLPNGKVLSAGGYHVNPEIFNPVTGQWNDTSILDEYRDRPLATLLPNGKVLIAGGFGDDGGLTTAKLFDSGLCFSNSWRPQITSATSPLNLGATLTVSGSGFQGISEAASSNPQNSSANYPLVQLRSLENGLTTFLLATNWSANSFTSLPVWNFPPGYAFATVFANGIQSTSAVVNITVPTPVTTTLTCAHTSVDGSFQFAFTNNPGTLFGVLASTNLTLPSSNWDVLSGIIEASPGNFQFTDIQATNVGQRFYRIFAP